MYSNIILKYKNKYDKNKNKYRPKLIRRNIPPGADLSSILGKKRSYDIGFKQETYDDSRYGQHININFFEKNIGHIVI